jgi:hypothetical protein
LKESGISIRIESISSKDQFLSVEDRTNSKKSLDNFASLLNDVNVQDSFAAHTILKFVSKKGRESTIVGLQRANTMMVIPEEKSDFEAEGDVENNSRTLIESLEK